VHSIRRIADVAPIFASVASDASKVVYEIYGSPAEVEGVAALLRATTVLHPGQVDGEFFMTRGHFHTNPERGEFMVTLSGEGLLVLMNRSRECRTEPMRCGSIHDIDGRDAHRVVNTGDVPLVFLVVWMSDCGHDYEAIRERGFGVRVYAGADAPVVTVS